MSHPPGSRCHPPPAGDRFPSLGLEIMLLAVVVLVAAFLRLYNLEGIPPGLHGDEAWTGLDALEILDKGWIGPYTGHALGQPTGPLYWTALVFKLFGASIYTLRASMAVLAFLTIPATYLFFRAAFNPRVALIGISLLAFSFWHIHYSRIAFMLISLPLVEALCLFFLYQAFKDGRWPYFVAAGLFLGLSFYSYSVFPPFLLAVGLFLLFKLARGFKEWRFLTPRLALFCLAGAVVALPFLAFVIQNPQGYLPHFQLFSIFNNNEYLAASGGERALILAGKVARAAGVFFLPGQLDGSDGFGGKPVLDPLTGLLFATGIVACAWRWKDDRHFLVLAGVLAGLTGSILTVGGEYRRVIGTTPFVMLAAAIPLDYLWRRARSVGPDVFRVKSWAPLLLVLLAVGYVGFTSANYYFNELMRRPFTAWVFGTDLVGAIQHLRSLDGSTRVYFYSGRWSYNYEVRRFLLPGMAGEDRSREFGKLSLERQGAGPAVYLFMPPYLPMGAEIAVAQPGGQYQEIRDDQGRVLFSSYVLK